ncbi:MAG: ArgE/DapE family deacylase [Verrucomicrobiota bacterium]
MSRSIDTLSSLVSINSINPEWGGPGEEELASWIVNRLEQDGLEFWKEEVLPGRPNVIARVPGRDSSRAVALEAHMDTVSVSGMTIAPFDPVIQEGKLYGRGSCDTKSGLAAMLEALCHLAGQSEPPPCDVYFLAVIDEEHAFRGALAAIKWIRDRRIQLEAVVVSEPTGLRLVTANKGVLRFRIGTHGKSAHSSKPHLGSNAIAKMAEVIRRVERYHLDLARTAHPLLGSATGCISLIEGGDQINFVPDSCRISIDHRLLPGETAEMVIAEYRALFEDLPGEVKVHEPDLVDEAMETDPTKPVVRVARHALEQLQLPEDAGGVPFGCDVTKFSRAGVDGIIFGPGSIDQAHGAIEYVDLDQVEKAFEFYTRFLMNYR